MILVLAEKVLNYLLIFAILCLTSQTLLQWNDKRNIDIIKRELRDELEAKQEELQKQIIRIESQQREWIIIENQRMDTLENNKKKHKSPLE